HIVHLYDQHIVHPSIVLYDQHTPYDQHLYDQHIIQHCPPVGPAHVHLGPAHCPPKVPRQMIDVKPLHNNNSRDNSISSSQKTDSTTSSRHGLSSVFLEYSDKCSLVGVPYIRNAKNLCERTTGLKLVNRLLFASYFSYGKHTQISLGFDTLDFPAITFCNVNAMRWSQRGNASAELLKVIDAVSMDSLHKNVKQWAPRFDDSPNNKRYIICLVTDMCVNAPPGNMRENNFFDSMPSGNITSPRASVSDFYKQKYPDSWQGQCKQSTFDSLQTTFKDYWVQEPPEKRLTMGHQIQNMLIQCSYAGGQCVMSNFTVSQSTSYGNCYTIQNTLWAARRSGPDQGFQLILFLETDEYVPGITNEKGIQLIIHEQGTTAFPDDEGIAVAAGTQTVIGLRQ
ncbi:unnamed protein product, partial [Candidula unifasciata]